MSSKPLEGIRVLDLSELLPGPYATHLLRELGAEIIKVERAGGGDNARVIVPGVYDVMNRGKSSICLNLKNEAAREVFYRMAKDADVVIEGYRPGVVKRLGIDYDTLAAINPRIIYASISGYGQTGPYAKWPGHDLQYMATAGHTALAGDPEGPPAFAIGSPFGDISSSMFAVVSILSAVIQRQQTQKGQYLDVSITDGLAAWMLPRVGAFMYEKKRGRHFSKKDVLSRAGYGVYQAKDGRYFTIGAIETHFWIGLVKAVGIKALEDPALENVDTRTERGPEVVERLKQRFLEEDSRYWFEILEEHDVPYSPVTTLDDFFEQEHLSSRGLFGGEGNERTVHFPVPMEGLDKALAPPSPDCGQHTDALLAQWGYSKEDIKKLRTEGAIQ